MTQTDIDQIHHQVVAFREAHPNDEPTISANCSQETAKYLTKLVGQKVTANELLPDDGKIYVMADPQVAPMLRPTDTNSDIEFFRRHLLESMAIPAHNLRTNLLTSINTV